jgi:thiazole synthase ThiGH ThiG subunit
MARAFGMAVKAAEIGVKAGPPAARSTASATSPMDIFK